MNCKKCNHELPDQSKFCFMCGTPADTPATTKEEPSFAIKHSPYFVIEGDTLVEYLGKEAHVEIPFGVRVIGKEVFDRGLPDGNFGGNRFLKSVTMPDTVKRIEERAFWCCVNLSEVSFSYKLEYIGDYAFEGCGLTVADIPPKVAEIGNSAFAGCKLTKIRWPQDVENLKLGSRAFSGNPIEELDLSNLNTNCISESCFSGCKNLAYFSSNWWNGKIIRICENAFDGTGFSVLTIPSTIQQIDKCAFVHCKNLKTVYFEDAVNVHYEAFYDCPCDQDRGNLLKHCNIIH